MYHRKKVIKDFKIITFLKIKIIWKKYQSQRIYKIRWKKINMNKELYLFCYTYIVWNSKIWTEKNQGQKHR